ADIFVPQYLRDIQLQPHTLYFLPPLNPFPSYEYPNQFFPPQLLQALPVPLHTLLISAPPAFLSVPLTHTAYRDHWFELLRTELDTVTFHKEQIVLWKSRIQVHDWTKAEFRVTVIGIRENYPWLDIGDIIHLRQVLEENKAGSSLAFEARIITLRKRLGHVHLHSPALRGHLESWLGPQIPPTGFVEGAPVPMVFNLTFLTNAAPFCKMGAAVNSVANALADGDDSLSRQWLFPEVDRLRIKLISDESLIEASQWIDTGLNAEQRMAVTSMALYSLSVPHIVLGPPGTGKTRTLVEGVLQILRVQKQAAVLLCAPSNPAADTLAMRLRSVLAPGDMLRLNDQNRTFAEVPVSLMQYCCIENDKFALPSWKRLMKYRVVVCSCIDADILVTARCTNSELSVIEREVVSAFRHSEASQAMRPHWTHLVIDEAAQGSEPELLIPVSVVATTNSSGPLDLPPQIVLCGDPNQLGPIVSSERARTGELEMSLLERLVGQSVYAHPSEGQFETNYRSHPAILMPPSAMFYDDTLEPCAANGSVEWSQLNNTSLPLMFIGHEDEAQCVDERATWYNPGEINRIVEAITSLLAEGAKSTPPLHANDIGVMAPWREQVWRLREKLREQDMRDVDVGTVEDYQGRESRVVILSCVRSHRRFLEEDALKNMGVIFEKKRMNVAITRARELLIVVGNGKLLSSDPYWKSFIQFTIRNKLYVGPELDLDMDGSYVSRLESKWILDHGKNLGEEDLGTLLAGGMARELLKD
ncbi:P-loop containing nucleoside triphosphate hydrolase protein, partial [Pluteus cervinus]